MPCPFPTFQLSGAVTVDQTTADPFLDTTRARYVVIAPGRLFAHADKAGAVATSQSGSSHANIVGHGEPGVICTGSGRFTTTDPLKQIDLADIGAWAPSGMTHLTLLGCNVGLGTAGSDLLFAIAQATGATVKAPTGYVYIGFDCDDFYVDPGSDWQTATPQARPADKPDDQPAKFDPGHLSLMFEERFIDLPTTDVAAIVLHGPSAGDTPGPRVREWGGVGTALPVSVIEFDKPARRGAPAAIETGSLEVVLQGANRQSRQFRIYNDNRIQDAANPTVLYRANIKALRV